MKTRKLSKKGSAAVNQLIGLHNNVVELHNLLIELKIVISDSLNSGENKGKTSKYLFNQSLRERNRSLETDIVIPTQIDNPIQINEKCATKISQHADIEFIFNYAYFYINLIISSETLNGTSAPVGYIVFGTVIKNEKIKESSEFSVKPLIKFKVNTDSKTISSLDNHPEKVWNFDDIDDFLWRTIADIWKEAIHWNNKSYLS